VDPGQAVADTVALADYLRERFGQQRIYLLGNSWGSTLGVLAVQQHPEPFHAYIGAGQMASELATDQIIYQQVLDWLDVPVYLVQGAHELSARSEPTREWFDRLQAPAKHWITFDNSGHIPQFEEFPRFREVLREVVGKQG
jgi:pimeloyl-ACP methyl ester carboxylesterase